MTKDFFNEAQSKLQEAANGSDVAKAIVERRVHHELTDYEIEFIEKSHFFFIASSHAGHIDCSFKGGEPGFVKVTGASQVTWPDYDGNLMFRTLGNISGNPNISMLFCNLNNPSQVKGPGQVGKIRLNGKATIHPVTDSTTFNGAKNIIVVDLDFILPNCPRYLPDMVIEEQSKFNPQENYIPPEPEWKSRDYIVPILNNGSDDKE